LIFIFFITYIELGRIHGKLEKLKTIKTIKNYKKL
jgi:hypothetical protein